MNETEIITRLQSIIRGNEYRWKNLPNSILSVRDFLKTQYVELSKKSVDGRVNSAIDEEIILKKLKIKYGNRIYIPEIKHWFDCAIYNNDQLLPINIKTTTTLTADNTGNLAMCVYSLTNYSMEIKDTQTNGAMSKVFIEALKNKSYNKERKRDYYFIVINKNDTTDIIANSVRGLNRINPNINNLPFQIRWKDNKTFEYKKIEEAVKMVIESIKKPKPSWSEIFLSEIRNIK
jgi:hypothetical protein